MPTRRQQTFMRRNIASLAAKLMAEDGINDYGFAKRKAAKQLGAPDTEALPTNTEVETELRSYQALYQHDEQPAILHTLRKTAHSLMQALEAFKPYLVGAVLEGTAGRFSEIELDIFSDNFKELTFFLLARSIPFEYARTKRRNGESPECVLELAWLDTPVRINVQASAAEHSSRRHVNRARIAAVETLLNNTHHDAETP